MTDILYYGAIGLAVAAILYVTYAFSGRLSQQRVAKHFDDPQEILTAADIYVRYGQSKAARALLQGGIERFPQDDALRARLKELDEEVSSRD